MNIIIRSVSPLAIKKIDELAKQKSVSRNEYLRHMLETFAALEEFKTFQEQYQRLLNNYQAALTKNTDVLSQLAQMIEEE